MKGRAIEEDIPKHFSSNAFNKTKKNSQHNWRYQCILKLKNLAHSLENICASNYKPTSTAQGSHKHEVRKPKMTEKRGNQECGSVMAAQNVSHPNVWSWSGQERRPTVNGRTSNIRTARAPGGHSHSEDNTAATLHKSNAGLPFQDISGQSTACVLQDDRVKLQFEVCVCAFNTVWFIKHQTWKHVPSWF